jgi:hypothetical protein
MLIMKSEEGKGEVEKEGDVLGGIREGEAEEGGGNGDGKGRRG